MASPTDSITDQVFRQTSLYALDPDFRAGPAKGNSLEGPKIICVGLVKTGLQSLREALHKLGYEHFFDQDQIVSTYPLWDMLVKGGAESSKVNARIQRTLGHYEVIMGLPAACFWEELVQAFPKAKVILTDLEEDQWWLSTSKAKEALARDVPGVPLNNSPVRHWLQRIFAPSYGKFCAFLRFYWAAKLGYSEGQVSEHVARRRFREHTSYVKARMASAYDASHLLVYNVMDGWTPLCSFLGLKEPEDGFPEVRYKNRDKSQPEWFGRVTGMTLLFHPDGVMISLLRRELLSNAVTGFSFATLLLFVLFLLEGPTPAGLVYLAVLGTIWTAYVVMYETMYKIPFLFVLSTTLKCLLIAGSLQTSSVIYGVLKEQVASRDKIPSALVLLTNRLTSTACCCLYLLATTKRVSLGASPLAFSSFAVTNEVSSWAGYEVMRYFSYRVQVMSKSAKMLPTMIVGRAWLGKRYSPPEYLRAVLALCCVFAMHCADEWDQPRSEAKQPQEWLMGVLMLGIFFIADSYTSTIQEGLYQEKGLTEVQMMLGGNLLGLTVSMARIASSFSKISASIDNMSMSSQGLGMFWRLLGLGVMSALTQFCIYSAISVLGADGFAWAQASQKLVSVLVSLAIFGSGISTLKVCCILGVFAMMFWKQLSRLFRHLATKAPARAKSKEA